MSVVQLEGGVGGGGAYSHAALTGLAADDHLQYLLLAGRAGGQSAFGGINAGDDLDLAGSAHAGGGAINLDSPTFFRYTEGNTTPTEQSSGIWAETFTTVGAYIGGFLRNDSFITYTNSVYIYSSVIDRSTHTSNAGFGFQAFTLFNALPTIRNGTSNDLVQMLILNDGGVHERRTSGTSTSSQHITVSASPNIRTTVSGAVMTMTGGMTGLSFAPKFSTVAGSTVNMGTLTGLQVHNPDVALFAPSAGVENATAIFGVDVRALTFGGNIQKAAVRSAIAAASNAYFLRNIGTARSNFGSSNIEFNDLFGVVLGNSQDLGIGWSALNFLFLNFALSGGQIRLSNPTAGSTTDRYLIQGDLQSSEFNLNCDRFSLGAQTGSVGNQVGAFVAPTRAVAVGGDWTDFLLTQAGNITVNAAMSLIAGWTINAPSITLGTGSVVTGCGLNIGGNPNQGTNRIGVRIISNPTGGGGVNAALWVTAGRSQFDGFVDINKPIALGGGAAATLGTIGGTGPTAAAQAQWVQIEVNGVNHWIPAWI